MTNIFLTSVSGGNDVSMFVDVFYQLLMRRQFVSYADIIYNTDSTIPDNFFINHTISSYKLYSPLKKAVALVRNEINLRYPGAIIDNGVSNNANFHRIGSMEGPEKLLTLNKDNIPVVPIPIILVVES